MARNTQCGAARMVAGPRADPEAPGRSHMLLRLLGERAPADFQFWWARRDKKPLAAALMLASPGKAGMIFYSSPLDCDADILVQLVRTVAQTSIGTGIRFVQALVDPAASADLRVLVQAGYQLLADLIYMRRELDAQSLVHTPSEDLYTWRTYGDFDEGELATVIAATYEQSLDCPGLAGVRRMEDIIATHKSCGLFSPDNWWVLEQGGRPAACILVNEYPVTMAVDVVYLGVTVPFRGRGISRLMLHRAGRLAMERAYSTMTLAVDSRNPYALRVYEAEQFMETGRRLAYAMLAGKLTP